MKERIFICSSDPYPYGTANSNYIRNFCKCLLMAGYEVFVVGIGKNRDQDLQNTGYYYENVRYHNLSIPLEGAKNLLLAEVNAGNQMAVILKSFEIRTEDYVCIYSGLFSVISNAFKMVQKDHIISIEVEWLQPFQYRRGRFDPMYIIWNSSFKYRMKKIDKFLPVSMMLQQHINENNKSACVIPVMTDSAEIYSNDLCVRKGGLTHFIYSGAATNKDAFPCMIEAIAKLSDNELKTIRLHFTSLKEATLMKCMIGKEDCMKRIRSSIVFHGWLEYEELTALYRQMDYILLARKKNVATLSNFPSKIPELMAYSVVPVCSNVGDYTSYYLQDEKDSIFFDEDQIESCCIAIRKALSLTDNELLEMKKNARLTAKNRFDYCNWAAIVRAFISS